MQKPKVIFAQALGALLTFGLREWILLVAPTIVCMSLILSIGPTLQHFVVGLLNSTAPTIYGTAFGESVTKFPELLFWLGEGFRWVFLLMAGLVVILSFRSRGFRTIVVGIGAYSFLVLSFNDIFTGLIKGTLTFSDMLTDVMANLGGSVLIAFIISAILWFYEQIFGLMEGNNKFWAQISASMIVVLFGFLISGITYYLSQYIYNPLSVRIDVRANAPLSNSLAIQFVQNEDGHRSMRSLSLLPETVKGGYAHAMSSEGRISVQWKKLDAAANFDAQIDLYSNCTKQRNPDGLLPSPASIQLENLSTLTLSFDNGISWVEIAEDPDNHFSISSSEPSMFGLHKRQEKGEVTYFNSKESKLSGDGPAVQRYSIVAPLAKIEGKTIHATPRTLSVIANDNQTNINFAQNKMFNPKDQLECKEISASEVSKFISPTAETISPKIPFGAIMVGAQVQIKPSHVPATTILNPRFGELNVDGIKGWFSFYGLDAETLKGKSIGKANIIYIEANELELIADGNIVGTNGRGHIAAFGEFYSQYGDQFELRFRGTAESLWLNEKRLSQTKWERLTFEAQAYILGIMGFIMAGILKLYQRTVIPRLRDNRPLSAFNSEFS